MSTRGQMQGEKGQGRGAVQIGGVEGGEFSCSPPGGAAAALRHSGSRSGASNQSSSSSRRETSTRYRCATFACGWVDGWMDVVVHPKGWKQQVCKEQRASTSLLQGSPLPISYAIKAGIITAPAPRALWLACTAAAWHVAAAVRRCCCSPSAAAPLRLWWASLPPAAARGHAPAPALSPAQRLLHHMPGATASRHSSGCAVRPAMATRWQVHSVQQVESRQVTAVETAVSQAARSAPRCMAENPCGRSRTHLPHRISQERKRHSIVTAARRAAALLAERGPWWWHWQRTVCSRASNTPTL